MFLRLNLTGDAVPEDIDEPLIGFSMHRFETVVYCVAQLIVAIGIAHLHRDGRFERSTRK
jgi:hypothetical protein